MSQFIEVNIMLPYANYRSEGVDIKSHKGLKTLINKDDIARISNNVITLKTPRKKGDHDIHVFENYKELHKQLMS